MARITAKNMTEAWNIANQIFPTDYEKDFGSSERAGYEIYRSTAEGHYYDYICDLGDRLELNLSTGKTVNVWIERDKEEPMEQPEEKPEEQSGVTTEEAETEVMAKDEAHIEVVVHSHETGAAKRYSSHKEFLSDLELFMSGDKLRVLQDRVESAVGYLCRCGDHGMAVEFIRDARYIKVIYS